MSTTVTSVPEKRWLVVVRSLSDVSRMSADVAFFLCVLGGRLCHGGLCQGKHRSYCTEVSGSRRPSTSKSDSVSPWLSRAMFVLFAGSIAWSKGNFILHATALRFVTFCTADDQFRQSVRARRVCFQVLHLRALLFFDKGLIFLSPMEFRSASSERGADESTGRKSRRDGIPTCHQGMFPGSFLC